MPKYRWSDHLKKWLLDTETIEKVAICSANSGNVWSKLPDEFNFTRDEAIAIIHKNGEPYIYNIVVFDEAHEIKEFDKPSMMTIGGEAFQCIGINSDRFLIFSTSTLPKINSPADKHLIPSIAKKNINSSPAKNINNAWVYKTKRCLIIATYKLVKNQLESRMAIQRFINFLAENNF
ncbi:unnamed protein product [Gordionus sp. m RMFG-2023]